MPGPSTPPSEPTPLPASLSTSVQRQSRLLGLREALKYANVQPSTADKIVQQQTQIQVDEFYCYVTQVWTTQSFLVTGQLSQTPTKATAPDTTWVHVGTPETVGIYRITRSVDADIYFPPNDPKYLNELVRAQNYGLRIFISLTGPPDGQSRIINYMFVERT
jgi:hypothetical protein